MANTVTSQTLLDGDRNLVMLFTGLLDTSNEARVVKVDVSTLVPAPTKVVITKLQYSISSQLTLILDWDADTDIRFAALSGQGELEACAFGGLSNNGGAGVTGDIALTTVGWASGSQSYTLLLEMRKVAF